MTIGGELPSRPGGTAPHVIVADVSAPVLTDVDQHHLGTVRRLRQGDLLSVTNGKGSWRWCAFGAHLAPLNAVLVVAEPSPKLTVCFALVKGEKPELVVQKLTELGIDVIVPFLAQRSVARWDKSKAAHHHQRFVKVAAEAAMQSRRVWLPEVREVSRFESAAEIPGARLADREGDVLNPSHQVLLIGPEGGWDDAERTLPTVAFNNNVLRAETAAIAAGSLMAWLRGGETK